MIAPTSHPHKEADVGQTISSQHPAVVLRSRYQQVRALLAVAMIAVVGLTAAVVVLALDGDSDAGSIPAVQVSTPGSSSTDHDESVTGAAIGSAFEDSARSGGPDESVVADAISGR